MLVRRLLDAGIDVDDVDAGWRTPLGTVLFDGGSATLVRALLDAGADPTHLDVHGYSVMHLMRSVDAATILPWLLDAGLPIDSPPPYRTPVAVQARCLAPPETLRAMLDAGAPPGAARLELHHRKLGGHERHDYSFLGTP